MNECPADTPLAINAAIAKTSKQSTIDALMAASPSILLLRDGELVLYRRTRSLLYQCLFKLADGKWHRFSTRKASLENAIAAACDMYDEARYRLTHSLRIQQGNSAAMIERHCSKLTATMSADRLRNKVSCYQTSVMTRISQTCAKTVL